MLFVLDIVKLIANAIDKDKADFENQKQQVLIWVNQKEYDTALNKLIYLKKLKPKDDWIYYNLACIYSLKGLQNEALNNIELAVKHGYKKFDKIDDDPDLLQMRKHPFYPSFKNNGFKMNLDL